ILADAPPASISINSVSGIFSWRKAQSARIITSVGTNLALKSSEDRPVTCGVPSGGRFYPNLSRDFHPGPRYATSPKYQERRNLLNYESSPKLDLHRRIHASSSILGGNRSCCDLFPRCTSGSTGALQTTLQHMQRRSHAVCF